MDSFNLQRELHGGLSYTQWFEEVEEARSVIGSLIGSTGEHIALFQNTSHALNTVADSLPLDAGDEVITTDLEFPSNTFPWVKLRQRGIKVTWVRSRNGVLEPSDIEEAVGPRTRAITVSHVCYYNGFRMDLEALAETTSRDGIFLIVDAMQSLGALQLDVQKLKVDFLASNSYKWLLGPFGVATLYCRDTLTSKLKPTSVGWYSIRDIWSREIEEFELSDTARRFETGHPNFSGIRGLRASVELLEQVGPSYIEQRILKLTRRIREGLLSNNDVKVLSPESGVSGVTLFAVQGRDSANVVASLRNKGIVVFPQKWKDGTGIKVSPHFYNTEDEIDDFLEYVRSLSGQ